MSAAATPITSARAKPMEVLIVGRVDASRRHERVYFARVITPAPDAYSRPQVVEVRSKHKLGELGDEISVTCKLGGFTRRPFRATDKDTGETQMVTPVDMTLDVLE